MVDARPSAVDEARRKRRRRTVIAIIIVLIILALLLLRGCPALGEPFDYFRAKATELKNDRAAIVAWVKGLPTADYRGDAKGPLAALWNGGGSAEEKLALANALLATLAPPVSASLDDVTPDRKKDMDAERKPFTVTVVLREESADGTPRDTTVVQAPVGSFVGDVHSVDYAEAGKTRVTIRGNAAATSVVERGNATGEDLVLTIERPDDQPLVLVRELWHEKNRVGPDRPETGDRHDFVVLPCRTSAYVREKEELILKQRSRSQGPEAQAYLALLDYTRTADFLLGKLEKDKAVRARFDTPRIIALSRFVAPQFVGHIAWAFDLRWNRVAFDGEPLACYEATQLRSLVEGGLQERFLTELSKHETASAPALFTRLGDDFPNSETRRLEAIREVLAAIEMAGPGVKATLDVHDRGARSGKVSVTVTCEPDGLRVQGGPANPEFVQFLSKTEGAPSVPFTADGLNSVVPIATGAPGDGDGQGPGANAGPEVLAAALVVEAALLGAKVEPPVPSNYVLGSTIDRTNESLVARDAVFDFVIGKGETRTDERFMIQGVLGELALRWRIQDSVVPIIGNRTVAAGALEGATVHNPWYAAGDSLGKEATSFCISRKVAAALRAGKPIDFALESRLEPGAGLNDPRKKEWQGSLAPLGAGTVTVPVNGRPETLATLRAKLGDSELVVLDDLSFPVGMADKISRISTSVRGRLIDENGIGIGGAAVVVRGSQVAQATTIADGSFTLPPPKGQGYGSTKVTIIKDDASLGERDVDLTAPGRSVTELSVPRPRIQLRWIVDPGPLDDLPLSDQVKRLAHRDLDLGNMIVIPSAMVGPKARQEIAYFSCDRASGSIAGVTEYGVAGSSVWSRAAIAPDPGEKVFWSYANSKPPRKEAERRNEFVRDVHQQLLEWHDNLELTGFSDAVNDYAKKHLGDPLGGAATLQLGKELGPLFESGNIKADVDTAKSGFKLGYMDSLIFLDARTGDGNEE
jgi:hypothetical protein